jgi:ADP-ribosylglycohydrolase
MLGSIIGDIAGSKYEYDEFEDSLQKVINVDRRKSIFDSKELFSKDSFISDDTILTIAIADAVLSKKSYEEKLREYGHKYYNNNREHYFKTMFSPGFIKWLNGEKPGNSIGNGSAMRVSPVAYLYDDLRNVEEEARKSAIPSHNSIEGIKGAQAIAGCIFLSRNKKSKREIAEYITNKYGYDLNIDIEDLTNNNTFNSTCEITVPQAISIFLQSNGFEDSIKKAISIGGDTDTIACMTGGISEAYYGIPKEVYMKSFTYIPPEFREVIFKTYEEKNKENNVKEK